MNAKELKETLRARVQETQTLANLYKDGAMPADVQEKIQSKFAEIEDLKAQLVMAEKLEANAAFMAEPEAPKAAPLAWQPAGPEEGNPVVDTKAFREIEIKTGSILTPHIFKVRYHVPLAVQGKGYLPAFEAYVRKGWDYMGPADRKALTEGVDSAGGYLVPEDLQAGIIAKMATLATVRLYARVVTTSRDVVSMARRKYTTDNLYTSGVRVSWPGETPSASTAHEVTDQVFGQFQIPVHTAMASQNLSRDLIEDDAFDVVADSSECFGEAFALGEEDKFWDGSGAGVPRGILTDAADTTNFDAALATAAAANTIDADEVIAVAYDLPTQYERGARWFFTKATEKAIRQLKDSTSDYIWPLNRGLAAADDTLLGFPYTRAEFMDNISNATNTTTYPLVFGDLGGYVVVDRVGMSVERYLDSATASLNQIKLIGRHRVGGQLVEAYKLSLLKTVNST